MVRSNSQTRTDIGLFLLQLYRANQLILLEREIYKLSYSELEYFIDHFNGIKEFELSQLLFDNKIVY